MKTFIKKSIQNLTIAFFAVALSGICFSQTGFIDNNPEECMADATIIRDSSPAPHSFLPEDHRSAVLVNRDAQFEGGNHMVYEYMLDNFNYPEFARNHSIQGKMRVAFDIGKNGEVSNVHIVEHAHYILEKELIRTIESMPKWQPALKYGSPTKTTVELPFKATLL